VEELKDLSLIEVHARESDKVTLAIHLTGDGGWGVTDKGICEILAYHGIPLLCFYGEDDKECIGQDLDPSQGYSP
jgi:type IV secretory pathway VirJ component